MNSNVNGVLRPVAGAFITVCAAGNANVPCAPPLAGVLFKDQALTQPLANPTTTDLNGNYPTMALAAGNYTITETAVGFTGFSYQITITCGIGGCAAASLTVTGATTLAATTATNLTVSGGLDSKYLGATRFVCNKAGTSSGWAGADVSVWTNAAIAEVITAGGGTVDASSCTGTQTISQEIDVGNSSSVPVKLLLPHTGTWLINGITDGVSYALKLFHNSSILGSNGGYGGSMQIRPANSSVNVGAFVGNDTTVPNAHLRIDGFEAVIFSGTATVAKAICYFSGLADESFVEHLGCVNLSSTNAPKVLWVNNSCCGTTIRDVGADAFSVAGVTPCTFGNGTTGPNLNISVDGISCVHPGNGASALVDQQWNQFGNNIFKNVYMEMCVSTCFQAFTDTTTPWISVQKFGTPTAIDLFIGDTAGGDVAASTRYTIDIASGSHVSITGLGQGAISTNAINDHNGTGTTVTSAIQTTINSYSTDQFLFNPGTQAAPSIVNAIDTTTGFHFSNAFGDHKVIFTGNGTDLVYLTTTGASGAGGILLNKNICDAGTANNCLTWAGGLISASGPGNPIFQDSNNTKALTADWTCGTGGTVASCVAATIIGSGGGVPLTFTLPLVAGSYTLTCDGVVGQATAATLNQWNLLTATNGATNVTANYTMASAVSSVLFGAVTDQASTTTTFQIAPSWTLGGTGTKMPFHIWAKIEGASVSGTVVSLQLVAPTVADLVTIYRGTSCSIY